MIKSPNFIVAGVPKAGTSSLYNYLIQHPEIYLPKQKELHYFTCKELFKNTNGPGDKLALKNIIKSKKAYDHLYREAEVEKALGDISPSYFYYSSDSIPRMKSELQKGFKAIIILRNPITRTFSNFLHQKRLQYENMDFNAALMNESKRKQAGYGDIWRYKEHSLYYENCKNFIDNLGQENVKFLLFEDLISDSKNVVKEICSFLGISSDYEFKNLEKVYNKGGIYKKNLITRILLKPSSIKEIIRKAVGKRLQQVYKRIKAQILSKKTISKPCIEENTIQELKRFFDNDVQKLKEFNIDLSKWKHF